MLMIPNLSTNTEILNLKDIVMALQIDEYLKRNSGSYTALSSLVEHILWKGDQCDVNVQEEK